MNGQKKIFIFICFGILLSCILISGCQRKNGPITSVEQLNDSRYTVGAWTGEAGVQKVEEFLPNAVLREFSDLLSGYAAVQEGKIDAFVFDRIQMGIALRNGLSGVRLLDENLGLDTKVVVGISPVTKIPDLTKKINTFLDEIRNDGTLDDMHQRWVVDRNEEMPDIPAVTNPKLHLIVGTTGIVEPYSYYIGTELTGYDIELSRRFAAWMDADLEFKIYDYGGIIIAAQTGEIDCICANLNLTPERAEKIGASDPVYVMRSGILVRDTDSGSVDSSSFIASIKDSFYKTFIWENRYRLFLQGILTTVLITVLSIIFGTLLGFFTYLWCRNGGRFANSVTSFCVWLIQGMPMVVLLLILYYVVFASFSIDASWVAVIGFSLTFGAAVYGMLQSGVNAVSKGQTEAAYALGFNDRKAFMGIVLPQAAQQSLPAYKSEMVSLIKATAIVGYIAVQDLTKMGEIVRSRTYEAFFPLITVAVIYFILAGILTFIVNHLTLRLNPKRRGKDQILKGIRTDD